MFQTQRKDNRLYLSIFNKLSYDLTNAITSSKLAEYRQVVAKLSDSKTSPKSYWFVLKSVMEKKFLTIPPLLVNDQLVANFLIKANLLSHFLSQQCNTTNNDRTLPSSVDFNNKSTISSFDSCNDEITRII